ALTYSRDVNRAISELWRLLDRKGIMVCDFTKSNAVVHLIRFFNFFLRLLPLKIKFFLAERFVSFAFLFKFILGEKASRSNRDKMLQVVMSSVFSPTGIKALTVNEVLELFKSMGARSVSLMNLSDSPSYTNKTTFMIKAEK
ncbi:MAG TPA: hypothetical protein PLU24_02610, partial [Candidatus Omnitrophota bacterium]|nr:hypothetical protein [Candidatus Omnitrophota bacterium]